jgi:hypothetical protein
MIVEAFDGSDRAGNSRGGLPGVTEPFYILLDLRMGNPLETEAELVLQILGKQVNVTHIGGNGIL